MKKPTKPHPSSVAHRHYLLIRRRYIRGKASINELAHALALADLAIALASVTTTKERNRNRS